ncbi:hypothetical protein L21SP3_00859 [Sedimentisphaera cyanobacteriorum]|uniref:Transcription factor zinc-finger domain-containing protein n=1 Tax=Sedimentisphaera cyanobacteriorum TaxID=1940790 RepID=A0A1Q2HP09_9BACT|nr:zf-TFIIB domain-containing protein [Sedimentisphaera cyanobacteriorum]AQQ09061.1 hypothetical protein L21SP3_00859 [Sedimentisphaera cyanobacteriorum]
MECPVCKEPMIILELDEVEIDYCAQCSGIWLDSGELELLLGEAGESLALEKAEVGEKSLRCPICMRKMKKVYMGSEKVLIDSCPAGHGLWFDEGELHQVILAASGPESRIASLLKSMFEDLEKK